MPLNFSQLLGGAAFSSLNAILGHNASRDGYSRPNRFEVIITLPAGVSGASSQGAGDSALASNIAALRSGETARRCHASRGAIGDNPKRLGALASRVARTHCRLTSSPGDR